MTLLTDADQQHINNDMTLVLVPTEGRQQFSPQFLRQPNLRDPLYGRTP